MTDIARERFFLAVEGLEIITRETWGAVQAYTSDREVFEPVEGFVLHISVTLDHGDLTGTEHVDMRTIERIGQERFGIGFPYNAAVFDTSRLYEGQPLTRRGAHTVDDKNIGYPSTGSSRSMNYWWRAIVLPQMVDDDVTDAQVDQCARWAAAQIRAGYAKRDAIWIGHRDVAWKACPGDTGYARLPEIRALTEHYVINGLEDSLSAAEVAEIKTHVTAEANRVINETKDSRPFFAQDYERTDNVLWVVYKDSGTKRVVPTDTEGPGRALLADRVFSDGVWPNGYPRAWPRSKAHLDTYETVGPVPPGWDA